MSDYLDPNNEELLKDFFSEAQLQVDILEQNVLVLENDASNKDAIDEIFRAAHTLKGGAGTVEMVELAGFTHLVEDVLDEIRSGLITVARPHVDALLHAIDVIKSMLESRLRGSSFKGDTKSLESTLKSFLSDGSKSKNRPLPSKPKTVSISESGLSEYEILEMKEAAGSGNKIKKVVVSFNPDTPMNTVGGIQVYAVLKGFSTILKTNPDFEKLYEDNYYPSVTYFIATDKQDSYIVKTVSLPDVTTGAEVMDVSAPQPIESSAPAKSLPPERKETRPEPRTQERPVETVKSVEEVKEEPKEEQKEEYKTKASMGSILRVDSKRIDILLNLVSETVINKATFNQITSQFNENLTQLQTTAGLYREKLKDLFDSLPEFLETLQNGSTVKEVKKQIQERFGDLFTLFDAYESNQKNTVGKFRSTAQNLGRITADLQEGVMRIRMVPISQIFSRFPRLVRDLSRSLSKDVKLIIEGEDTELDKSVIEDLLDPLIHCVRNSIDHGIESPEERKKAGKSEEGHVLLKASNEGNMIIIEIIDDGKGIDIQAIREKAIDRGIIHPNKNLSETEAFNLIFDAGFSTAKKVTNISGRGVGLDVVRKQIDKLNGVVSVWSELGKGTKFTIKLPLTLAIIQGLLVKVGTEIYAIPITSVIESHRVKPSEIKMIDNYEVFNVRNDVISLLRLNRLFKIPVEEKRDYTFVVIVGSGDKKMGLMVDSLIGEEDVVIKPLKDQYTNSPGIAGATILGDGTVSLIIDVSQLLDLGLRNEMEERKKREATIK